MTKKILQKCDLPKDKCEIDSFQAGFCNMSFILIIYTTSYVKSTTLVVLKILVKNEICFPSYFLLITFTTSSI